MTDRYSEAEMTKIARAEFKRGKKIVIAEEIEFLETIFNELGHVPDKILNHVAWSIQERLKTLKEKNDTK